MKTIKRGIRMDNFDYLTEVLNDYCIKYNLPIDMSADDMIYYFYNNDDSFKENPYHLTDSIIVRMVDEDSIIDLGEK